MYVESLDRALIRKALYAMSDLSLNGLAAHEVDELDEATIAFLSATLRGVLARQENDTVIARFGSFDLERLSEIRTGFEAASVPQSIDATDRVKLTEAEVLKLQAKLTELQAQRTRLTERIDAILAALVRSGEAKLREIQHVQTWYYDTENTHGVKGLVTVATERTENLSGVGPDYVYVGTAEELAKYFRSRGYTDLDTDIEILRLAWKAQSGS